MRRILLVNICILLVFASISYWSTQKNHIEAAMAESTAEKKESTQQTEESKPKEEEKKR